MPKHKPYEKMNTAELAAATAEYDKPWTGPGLPGKPLTAAQRAQHRRASAHAKAGWPKIGALCPDRPRKWVRGQDPFASRQSPRRLIAIRYAIGRANSSLGLTQRMPS